MSGGTRAAAGGLDILAFGAHPDDVEIGAAGTLARAARGGASTGIITLTRGEMGSRGTLKARAAELDASAAVLGLAHHEMLSLPDGRLSPDDASKDAIIRELREHRPRIVLLPWPEDRHPDHHATSRIVQEAAFLSGLKKIETGQAPHRPAMLVYYMAAWEFEPSFIVDVSDVIDEKRRSLAAYGTQVWNPGADPGETPTYISSEHYMQLVFARMGHYGRLIGRAWGEPFRIKGYLEVQDLLAAFGDRVF